MTDRTGAGTGIAGAMDRAAAQPGGLACCICGTVIEGSMRSNLSARAQDGKSVIHACSPKCAADPRFSGGRAPKPREPTAAMVLAAMSRRIDYDEPLYVGIWRAMWDAAGS